MQKLICIPITERDAGSFWSAYLEAARAADIVELRLDYLSEGEESKVLSRITTETLPAPLILTFRPREQGGMRDLSLEKRVKFWESLPPELLNRISLVDFELELVEHFATSQPPVSWNKVICSNHDFQETPADIGAIFERISKTPAGIAKIACLAKELTDCVKLFELMAESEKPFIILGMGIAGISTRVLAPAMGAVLTFGSLRKGAESASGQPTAEELKLLYRADKLDRSTEIYGVVAHPVGHSRSPFIHNAAFSSTGRNAVYLPFEASDLKAFFSEMVRPGTRRIDWNFKGLSVTIPHKLAVMELLDEVDPIARAIGAVNTVAVQGEKLCGFNTDVTGAMRPLEKMIDLSGVKAAVLGAGGAARAICAGLKERSAAVEVYARNPEKAASLTKDFQVGLKALSDFSGGVDVVINCTPVGMTGHNVEDSPVAGAALRGAQVVFDLIYSPEETVLMRDARMAGCQVLGGAEMLIGQAAEQYRIWTGEEAPNEVMAKAFKFGTAGINQG